MTTLLTYDEAAERYKVPKEMIVRAVNEGSLRAIKNGTNWVRLRECEIDRWLAGLEAVV